MRHAKEGFLTNPRACTFDFKKLACAPGAAASEACLTPPQLKTVETFYGGLHNGKGELIFSGQALGNPLPALRANMPEPGAGNDTVRIWAFQNDRYDWHTFDLDRDMPIINSKVGFVDAVDPDLSKFKAHGGKLLLYAGWGDTTITPENTVLYYDNLTKKMGPQSDFVRLFMVPGMAHCRGGDGPNTFDSIGAMEAWREKGVTPTQLTGFNPQTSLTRPHLLVSPVREVQGQRQHQGRRQLDLRGAMTGRPKGLHYIDQACRALREFLSVLDRVQCA